LFIHDKRIRYRRFYGSAATDFFVLVLKLNLQTRFLILTVSDEEALQHVNQEMEAKAAAPFTSDRFNGIFLSFLFKLIDVISESCIMYWYKFIYMVYKTTKIWV